MIVLLNERNPSEIKFSRYLKQLHAENFLDNSEFILDKHLIMQIATFSVNWRETDINSDV